MNYHMPGSAVLVQVFMLTLFSIVLYVFLHSASNTVAIAALRYAQEREQQASHGLFLYGVAYAKQHYDQFLPGKSETVSIDQWPELEHQKTAQLTFKKEKNSLIINSALVMKEKTLAEQGIVQRPALAKGRWHVTAWRMTIE